MARWEITLLVDDKSLSQRHLIVFQELFPSYLDSGPV